VYEAVEGNPDPEARKRKIDRKQKMEGVEANLKILEQNQKHMFKLDEGKK